MLVQAIFERETASLCLQGQQRPQAVAGQSVVSGRIEGSDELRRLTGM
jgi:hypothetical protein